MNNRHGGGRVLRACLYGATAFALLGAAISACSVSKPPGIEPVAGFELPRYLGRWYEIARLDHAFEQGLSNVTAQYRQAADGTLTVVNRGFDPQENAWQQAEGRAKFVGSADIGFLKVSFFGPFYGAYVIFELDKRHYQYALVTGDDRSYFWLLARDPELDADLIERLLTRARQLGIATDELIWVAHERAD